MGYKQSHDADGSWRPTALAWGLVPSLAIVVVGVAFLIVRSDQTWESRGGHALIIGAAALVLPLLNEYDKRKLAPAPLTIALVVGAIVVVAAVLDGKSLASAACGFAGGGVALGVRNLLDPADAADNVRLRRRSRA